MPKRQIIDRYSGLENVQSRSANQYARRLFDEGEPEGGTRLHFQDIPLEEITPRPVNRYAQNRIDRLANSIRKTGNRLINPITLVAVRDLPRDANGAHPLLTAYFEKGIIQDESQLHYIIVAGERRYRAFCKLRDEENAKPHYPGYENPFHSITANVLTELEAENEAVFYEDSNTESRQLNAGERMRLFEAALSEVDTDEKKQAALLEMERSGFSPGFPIPENPYEAAKKFRKDKFCAYYINAELGVEDYKESTARTYCAVMSQWCDPVREALYDGKIQFQDCRSIVRYKTAAQQEALLNLLLSEGREAFDAQLKSLALAESQETAYTPKTARAALRRTLKLLGEERMKLLEQSEHLDGEARKAMENAVTKISATGWELDEILKSIKKL